MSARQPGLFDTDAGTGPGTGEADAAFARGRMREAIGRLRGASVPPWRDEAGVILEDGAFRRAMRMVPAAEAEALWAEYDREMERLYAVWAGGRAG